MKLLSIQIAGLLSLGAILPEGVADANVGWIAAAASPANTQTFNSPQPILPSEQNHRAAPAEAGDPKGLRKPFDPQPPVKASTEGYPRQPIVLEDEAQPGTDFWEFRQQLRQIVRDRDADAIRAIALPDINLTFGPPMTLDDLEIDNPDALFWQHLERAISTGCATLPSQQPDAPLIWACPHVFAAEPLTIDLVDPFEQVFIVAENVNVRAEPDLDSPVVGLVSHEVVKYDAQTPLDPSTREAGSTLEGWIPVILPNGWRGFVSSRYAYSPIGYRTLFVRENETWRMQTFVAGD